MKGGEGMTLRHLRIFVAVADLGKMSAAAKALFLSQSTVSPVSYTHLPRGHRRLLQGHGGSGRVDAPGHRAGNHPA